MRKRVSLSRELKEYARNKGFRILDHTLMTRRKMTCALRLIDDARSVKDDCPPDEAIIAMCHEHEVCIALEVIRK